MTKERIASASGKSMTSKKRPLKKRTPDAVRKLSETEQDLLWHLEHGYQLETDSLGGELVLRGSKDSEVVRPASANHNTVEGLAEKGLITQAKSRDPLKIVWRAQSTRG